mgnify:CR=1 FL=1
MKRLYLIAEGQTEQTFADTLIKPHLALRQVYMQNPVLVANTKKKGRVHRGGGRRYAPMRNDIIRLLKQDKKPDVYFTTMIDLYALYSDFPGLTEAEQMQSDPFKRVKFLEQKFAEDIDDPQFIPYLQLHEYEAYLFSDPTCFEYLGAESAQAVETLQNIASQYETPDLINGGEHTAPSKRIIDVFPDYKKAKTTFGPQLAAKVGLSVIRDRCSHFNEWLSKLESLDATN